MVMYCMNQIACFFVYFPSIFVNVDLIVSSLVLNEFLFTLFAVYFYFCGWVSCLCQMWQDHTVVPRRGLTRVYLQALVSSSVSVAFCKCNVCFAQKIKQKLPSFRKRVKTIGGGVVRVYEWALDLLLPSASVRASLGVSPRVMCGG